MSELYLSAVLDEAERVAEQHDQIARSADDPAHEYLRYAVLRLLEGETDETTTNGPEIDDVTVGYGEDDAMFDSWGDDVVVVETVAPQDGCTRFRIFYPNEHKVVPRGSSTMMAALGAWRVWAGNAAACGSYNHRERREVHYRWPEGHPVEELLHERLSGPAEAVAPDGGRTGDVRDRLVVDESCTCPDWQQRIPDGGCKHMRRVDNEIKRGRVPRPDGRLPIDAD